ncbi:non-ribosomal peptide synthetase [Streptomyces pseudovenezuelae]|uniref:Amino acid adenylation domain-containing protein n=1 Tax=Streptomyces pseudovenezuelae TaxID=67350 RepID=A0ABT6LD81_9ACTN|nr:amino acid adenylation domain-containing protein [Streptomyces pseudovenezuelae]MDH6214266.1 amino acid adenylation domain-containing protein [Streptomyces pseudovenezuelae]
MQNTPHPVPAVPTPRASADTAADGTERATRVRPASFAQQRLWFLAQLPGANAAYNETVDFSLTGPLDHDLLSRAFDALTVRHEVLRTRLVAGEGEVRQHIDPPGARFALTFEDLTDTTDPDLHVAAFQLEEEQRPFDLEAGPLGRGRLLTVGPERHVLLLTFHHSIYDGVSMNVMMDELGEFYRAFSVDAPDPLPAPAVQFADHAGIQLRAVLDGGLGAQEDYWRRALQDAPPVLELPTDHPRPAEQQYEGGRAEFGLDAEVTAGLRGLARRHGATPFVAVLTGWAILLSRLSGQDDIVVGSPFANRRGSGAAGVIGFLVNSLPLRIDLSGSLTVSEALARTRAVVRGALAHQDLPFERIVELVNPPRSASRTPLFQNMLAWVPERRDILHLPGVEAQPLPIAHAPAKFDLAVSATESDGRITGYLDYATALLDHSTAERWAGHLRHLLTDMARNPERDIRALELMEPQERRRVLLDGDATQPADADVRSDPGGVTLRPDPTEAALRAASGLVELFETQARERPAHTAVVDRDRSLDYAALDRRANHLAHALVARSVRPGDVVGLHAKRSCDLAVGILGILKAGAAYLPLDPGQPLERLAGMIEDAACPLVLSDHDSAERGGEWLDLSAVEAEGVSQLGPPTGVGHAPDRVAYVIFTSGSTGRPKGVAVEHRSVLNLFATWHARMGTAPGEVGSAWSSIGFDASIHELLLPLTTGGALHIVPEELRGDPEALLAWMREHAVTQAFLPPAYVKWIDEDPAMRLRGLQLRKLLTGVESLTEAALHRMTQQLPGLRVCFGYGPTEATLYSTAYYDPRPLERPCPIGRPLPGTRMYVLDSRMEPVPPGVVGEVYLGGASLARGYLGRPDLTKERFLPDPFVPGERIYRTGDLARRLPDGEAHYLGRGDDQVKLRGFRIEPAEVEAALMALPGVREAAVVVDRDAAGQPRLVAGIGRGTAPARTAHDWRTALARRLPDYMIPAVILDLEALPLNRSGKLDRPELLRLAQESTSNQVNTASPRDHVEHGLYRIWQRILLHPDIGVSDNFFEIGGTSLSAIKMAHAVTETFGSRLPVAEVMTRPTIEALAELLREDGASRSPGSLIEFRAGTGPRVVCVHPAGGTAFCYLPLAALLPEQVGLYGIQSPGVNPDEDLLPSVEAMAEAYLRMLELPGGGPLDEEPLVLTGLSYGGLVAHEMGRILARAGHRAVSVVLLDTQATDDPSAREEIDAVDEAEFRDKLVRFNGMYPGIDDAQVDRYFHLYNHNRLTAREHLPATSPTRLVLAQGVPDGADTPFHAEVREFWRRRAEGDYRVETMECDHWEILEGVGAAQVGALLSAELAYHAAQLALPIREA